MQLFAWFKARPKTTAMEEQSIQVKHPDLFQKWYDKGYEAGSRRHERDLKKDEAIKENAALRRKAEAYKQQLNAINTKLSNKAKNPQGVAKKPIEKKTNERPLYIKTNYKASMGVATKEKKRIINNSKSCVYCGQPATTVDHVIPKSRGGHNGYSNLVPCCQFCNKEKGNMTYDEYMTWRHWHYEGLY